MPATARNSYKDALDLQELQGKVNEGSFIGIAGLLQEILNKFDNAHADSHTHDGSTAEMGSQLNSDNITYDDDNSLTAQTIVNNTLDEILQHIQSAQAFIAIGLHSLRETTNLDVGAITANGGVLASDTTPILEAINAATDGCQRINWVAGNNDQVTFQIPLPPDLDVTASIVIHFRIVSGGTTDAVGFTLASFFNEGDTSIADTSGTNQTATYAEVTATIAAADVPAGAQTLTVGLTPVAHTTDTLALTALWIEYTRLTLAS